MGQIENIKQMRKARSRKRAAKKFFVLMFLSLIMIVSYLLWETIKDFDIKTKVNDIFISMGSGPGFPVSIAGKEAMALYDVSGMPALINDSNNFLYNEKGKTVSNIQHGCRVPMADSAGGKIMIYDLGGRKLKIYSKSRMLIEKNFDQNIINADMSESGDFAVALGSNDYVGQVFVHNDKGKSMFIWSSAENVITDVALSPSGQYLAVTAVNSDNGKLVSFLYIFKIGDNKISHKIEFSEEYPVEVCFKDNSIVTVLTDRTIRNYTTSGREAGIYDFSGKILCDFALDSRKNSILAFKKPGNRPIYMLVLLGEKNEIIWQKDMEEKVIDLGIDDKGVFITGEDKIVFYNLKGEETELISAPLVRKTLVMGQKVYYSTHNEVYKTSAVRVLE